MLRCGGDIFKYVTPQTHTNAHTTHEHDRLEKQKWYNFDSIAVSLVRCHCRRSALGVAAAAAAIAGLQPSARVRSSENAKTAL